MKEEGYADCCDHPDYYDEDVLLWGERQKASLEILERFQDFSSSSTHHSTRATTEPQRTPSKSSSVFSLAFSAASQAANLALVPFDILTSPLAGKPGDYDDLPLPLEDDIDTINAEERPTDATTQRRTVLVDSTADILNVQLTLSCLEFLRTIIHQGPPEIIPLPDPSATALATTLRNHWENQDMPLSDRHDLDTTTTKLISELPPQHITFLVDILVASGHLQRINRKEQLGKPDLLILPDPATAVDVQVAIYDLGVAMQQIEKRVQILEHEAEVAIQNAKIYKRKGNKKAAYYQVQRMKQFQNEIDNSYIHLTNLEKQKIALERAGDNKRIRQAMQQTAETLKNIRLSKQSMEQESQSNPVTVADILAEELEQVDTTALAMTTDLVESELDEEELLRELESYPDPSPSQTTSATDVDEKNIKKTSKVTPQKHVKEEKDDEDDIDVDDLLDELELLSVRNEPKQKGLKQRAGTSRTKHSSATTPASVYGGVTTESSDATSSSGSSMKKSRRKKPFAKTQAATTSSTKKAQQASVKTTSKKTKDNTKEKAEPTLASAVCL